MHALLVFLFLFNLFTADESHPSTPVRVITDGFNCAEGIIVADQIRELVAGDSLLKSYASGDSSYIVVEITSFRDGETSVINAAFAIVTPIQKNDLDYNFTRRLVSKTLDDMREISQNILEKIHLIRKS